jgi:hypothetical protein
MKGDLFFGLARAYQTRVEFFIVRQVYPVRKFGQAFRPYPNLLPFSLRHRWLSLFCNGVKPKNLYIDELLLAGNLSANRHVIFRFLFTYLNLLNMSNSK